MMDVKSTRKPVHSANTLPSVPYARGSEPTRCVLHGAGCLPMVRRAARVMLYASFGPLALGLLSHGCTNEPEADAVDVRVDSLGRFVVAPDEDTCTECLRVTLHSLLGDTSTIGDAPGVLEEVIHVASDASGRLWVGQRDSYKLFDAKGNLVSTLGRAGQGPLEFGSYPGPVYVGPEGNVHIVDLTNARESVFGTDLTLQTTHRLLVGVNAIAPLPAVGTRVANAIISSPERLGLPLHILEGERVVQSFGAVPGMADVETNLSLRRIITTDGWRIYAAPQYEYRIEEWDTAGHRRRAFVSHQPLNEAMPLPGAWSPESPPPFSIKGLQIDPHGRMWVLVRTRRDDWRANVEERMGPDGSVQFRPKDGLRSVYRSRIDVIDLDDGRLVATRDVDRVLVGFAGPGMAFENHLTPPNGSLQLAIWGIALEP